MSDLTLSELQRLLAASMYNKTERLSCLIFAAICVRDGIALDPAVIAAALPPTTV